MTPTRTATLTAGPIDGRTVHLATPGRFGGSIVTACNGRTIALAIADPRPVTCGSCIKAAAAGRIIVHPELAAEIQAAVWPDEVAR